jgi:hypothetical protein
MFYLYQQNILDERDLAPFRKKWKNRILDGTDPSNVLGSNPSAVVKLWPRIERNLDDYIDLTLRGGTGSLVPIHEKNDEWFMMGFHKSGKTGQWDPMDEIFLLSREFELLEGLTPPQKDAIEALSLHERHAVMEWLREVEGLLEAYARLATMTKQTISMMNESLRAWS